MVYIRDGQFQYQTPRYSEDYENGLFYCIIRIILYLWVVLLYYTYLRARGNYFGQVGPHCRRQCIEARHVEFFFCINFSGWASIAPSCFALHCHWILVSVTVSQEHF